jgi:hypothetical protein
MITQLQEILQLIVGYRGLNKLFHQGSAPILTYDNMVHIQVKPQQIKNNMANKATK